MDITESLQANGPRVGLAAGGVTSLVLLVLCGLKSVPPLQWGVRYNGFNKFVDIDNVYGPGRHFVWPWSDFLLFPATVQNVEFTNEARLQPAGLRFPSLHTRTKEGLALHLQVSLQYKLVRDKIGHLYSEFNDNYETFYIGVVRDTLIRVAAEYEAFELWEKREEVGKSMHKAVDEILQSTYATCWGLQLFQIELPETFDRSIIATQVVNQNISSMEFQQVATQIRAQTDVIQAEFDRKVKVVKAQGHANYTVATKTAKAHARSKTLMTESEVLGKIKDRLKVAHDDLLEYQEYITVAMLPNASVYFGFEADSDVILTRQQHHQGGAGGRSLSELDNGPDPSPPRSAAPADTRSPRYRSEEL